MFLAEFQLLDKKKLFAVSRVLDKKATKRLAEKGSPHKLFESITNPEKIGYGKPYGLSRMEEYALERYKNGNARGINSNDHFIFPYIRNKVDRGLRKLPTKDVSGEKLMRHIRIDEDKLPKFLSDYQQGKKNTMKYLTSTSHQTKGVNHNMYGAKPKEGKVSVKFLITPSKKTRSRHIEGIVPTIWNEDEQLFPSRSGFKTRKVNKTKKGYTIYQDEV